MTVVIAIMFILTAISATAFISARKHYLIDQVSENVITTIREAQNKAISVMDVEGKETKVWAVGFFDFHDKNADPGHENEKFFKLYGLSENGTTLSPTETKIYYPDSVKITYIFTNGTPLSDFGDVEANKRGFIYYSSPFGKAYLSSSFITDTATGCRWATDSTRPAKDYYLPSNICPSNTYVNLNNNPTRFMEITVASVDGDVSQKIIVKSNGDAYIDQE